MAEHVIHPNPGGPTHASSPYKRKLEEIRRSVRSVLSVCSNEDAGDILLVQDILDKLIERA